MSERDTISPMPMTKISVRWDGWTGAPGFSNFYTNGNLDSTQTDAAAAGIKTLLDALKALIPVPVVISFIPQVQILAEADGSLQDQRNIATVPVAITATGSGTFSAPSGMCITWRTAQSTGRRLLAGRTFIVPLATASYQADGTLSTATLNTTSTAANAYVNRVGTGVPGRPVVWHRPVNGASGFSGEMTGATVTDKAAVLRSRRD